MYLNNEIINEIKIALTSYGRGYHGETIDRLIREIIHLRSVVEDASKAMKYPEDAHANAFEVHEMLDREIDAWDRLTINV